MAGDKKKHHLDRPALPVARTAFRWQVPYLRALLILFQLYPDLTNGDRKNVMWHIFPELQARGYEEGHFYDQYQPRWSSSRSSKAWQAVEKPNPKSADTYTAQDLADHADMIRQVQAAAEALEIHLRPVSPAPAFARAAFTPSIHAAPRGPSSSAHSPSLTTSQQEGNAEPQDVAMADGKSNGEHEQVGGEMALTSSGGSEFGFRNERVFVSQELERAEHVEGPVRMSHMFNLAENDHGVRMLESNYSITKKGLVEHAVMGSLPGHTNMNHLPMVHKRDLILARENSANPRLELFPLAHEPDATQLPGNLGFIDPECDVYKFGGAVAQVTSMPEERTFAAMVCNTDVCKLCKPALGADFQISQASPTSGMPFVHTALDLGKLYLDHDQRTTHFMYDPLPLMCKERQGVSPVSTSIPDELLPANVRANWPVWSMMRCVLGSCAVCSNLVSKKEMREEDRSIVWE